jgi:hypothetical protein
VIDPSDGLCIVERMNLISPMSTDTVSFLQAQHASAINRIGSHVARTRGITRRLAERNQALADQVALEIENDLEQASEISGFHPDSCKRLVWWLRDWKRTL